MPNTQKIIYDEKNGKVLLNGKSYDVDEIKNFSKIFLLFGILLLLIGFFIMPIGVFFIIIGLYLLFQGICYNSCAKTLEEKIKTFQQDTSTSKSTPPGETISPEHSKNPNVLEPKIVPLVKSYNIEKSNTEKHNVAGTSFYQKDIASLKVSNEDFCLTKSEIIDLYMQDEKIYRYSFYPEDVRLIEEPENEYDSNAIKVVIDNIHVGYIKKESCLHIKELIKTNKIRHITADIHGGEYKILVSDYDIEKDKEIYTMEKNETDYFVTLSFELND